MMIQDPAADSMVKEPAAVVAEEDRSLGNSDRSLNSLPKVDLDDYGIGDDGVKDEEEDDNDDNVELDENISLDLESTEDQGRCGVGDNYLITQYNCTP